MGREKSEGADIPRGAAGHGGPAVARRPWSGGEKQNGHSRVCCGLGLIDGCLFLFARGIEEMLAVVEVGEGRDLRLPVLCLPNWPVRRNVWRWDIELLQIVRRLGRRRWHCPARGRFLS